MAVAGVFIALSATLFIVKLNTNIHQYFKNEFKPNGLFNLRILRFTLR
jgi:hypothetical protein